MNEIIKELERIKEKILNLPFSNRRSLQVDRLDAVIDFLKEQQDDNS